MTARDGASLSRHGDIIIVRRKHDEEEGHHGGVWKIAFADFMTAMMAFFLVMWLVNASDDATKRQVAQYFNPIKLNSSEPPSPELGTSTERPVMRGDETPRNPLGITANPDGRPVGGTETGGEDQAIFRDPYAVLAEIVADGGPGVSSGRAEPELDGTGLPGLRGGEAFRDPFDPTSWQLEPNVGAAAEEPYDPLDGKAPFATAVQTVEDGAPDAGEPAVQRTAVETPAPEPEAAEAAGIVEAREIEDELRRSVEGTGSAATAGLEVSASSEGIVISLADSLTNGMFEIGSARPSADTIRLVEEVAKVLAEREGTVVIRGHTDARPYTGGDYDNWRLSTARAHMAYYMLLRGGLDEARVTAIEGFADRRLKNESDPDSAANRRIEILLLEPQA